MLAGAHPSSSECQVGPALDKMPIHRRAIHTPLLTQTGTMETRHSPHMLILGYGWYLESPEKTYAVMGKTCKIHTDSGTLSGIDFFLNQHCNEMTLIEMMLSEDLLYMERHV